jgi:hypothetical protein
MVGNQGNGEDAPVHHPTQEELAVEVWEDESPAPEPEDEGQTDESSESA